jgi:1-acyl-sn-glycerol-3-phosphate acyltransferase
MRPVMTTRAAFPTPLAVRLSRLGRLALHLFRGLWIVHTRYGRLPLERRHRELQRWSRKLLAILAVQVHRHDVPDPWPARCMVVLNHVSWLDIFAVYAVVPGVFVAKSEIAGWPLVGSLVSRVGTLYIERGSRGHARRTNHRIAEKMAEGEVVCVCPEGTTTDGRQLRPFHAALLQPALEAEGVLQPLALRYVDARGEQTTVPAYVGEQSLLASMWAIASARRLGVELRFGPPLAVAGRHRRDLARDCEEAIAARLGVPPPHRAAGTRADPPAAPPSASRPTRSPYPAPEDRVLP